MFGCGNRDWSQTYQRIPTLCDKLLEDRGATRLFERGQGDAGAADFFGVFEDWENDLWKTICEVDFPFALHSFLIDHNSSEICDDSVSTFWRIVEY